MTWVFGILTALLVGLFTWGLISPRNQWRVLQGWSVPNQYRDEPSGAAYVARRTISGIGLLAIAAVLMATSSLGLLTPSTSVGQRSAAERLWGTPEPQLIDRVIRNDAAPPAGLIEMAPLGYQSFEDGEDLPDYVLKLRAFALLGVADIPGYAGSVAPLGSSAVGSADLLVNVRGPVLCVPRSVVVIETDAVVQIGIFYGLPDPAVGAAPGDNATACPAAAAVTGSVLVPVDLAAPVGERTVQSLAGIPIGRVG